jgi:hypothetical protein
MLFKRRFGWFACLHETFKGEVFSLYFHLPGKFPGEFLSDQVRPRNIQDIRLAILTKAPIRATEQFERNLLSQEELEIVLDYLYKEIGRRLERSHKQRERLQAR